MCDPSEFLRLVLKDTKSMIQTLNLPCSLLNMQGWEALVSTACYEMGRRENMVEIKDKTDRWMC